MQNTYQEKIDNLESNNAPVKKKLEGGIRFKIKSDFQPAGDQPEAIKKILKNLKNIDYIVTSPPYHNILKNNRVFITDYFIGTFY